MDNARFDRLTRDLSQSRLSRRLALTGGSLGLAGALFGRAATRAQGTPSAEPNPATSPMALFVQTAAGGTFLPNPLGSPDEPGRGDYLLTMSGHSGQTIVFTDRPARDFGQLPTSAFLETLGFSPVNPPNAAIVVTTRDGADDVLVVQLFNPIYDETAGLLIYEATILGEYAGENLAPVADRQQDDTLDTEFSHVSLFIDDCAGAAFGYCAYQEDGRGYSAGPIPGGPYELYWDSATRSCVLAEGLSVAELVESCNIAYPDPCAGQCTIGVV